MDYQNGRNVSSGIPRPSRLPLPTTPGQSKRGLRPTPSRERLQADRGLDVARLRRPSEEVLRSRFRSPNSRTVPSESYSGFEAEADEPEQHDQPYDQLETLADNDGQAYDDGFENIVNVSTPLQSKSSLSDRTIETLSRLPPTPSSRKESSSFALESPTRSASSHYPNFSRTPRQSSASVASQPPSPSKAKQTPRSATQPITSRTPQPKRSISSFSQNRRTSVASNASLAPPHDHSGTGEVDNGGARRLATRKPKPKPSLQGLGQSRNPSTNGSSTRGLSSSKPRRPSPTQSSDLTSPTSATSKISSVTSDGTTPASSEASQGSQPGKAPKSSSALRESIAKAKAARKAGQNGTSNNFGNQGGTALADPFENLSLQDPFNQLPAAGKTVLQDRARAARKSGYLNISALGLKDIPQEVMSMYDFDPDGSDDWYESVDVTKFIAGDNEIECLSDTTFPDVDVTALDLDEDVQGSLFGGLEVLDLHGNALGALPMGLRRLERMQVLNLSNNELTTDAFEVISQIENLTELRMANNKLTGALPPECGALRKLEILDLHENELTGFCDTLDNLTSLRVVNIAENKFSSLPFDVFSNLPIMEINAQKNCLKGHLVPASVQRLATLQILNVACNALESLSETKDLVLPSLQQLFADANRIESLPDVSSWQALLTLNLEDNNISELPEGFSSLEHLKNADFAGNSIKRLDDNIGLMENLMSLRVANNPLVERKFFSMDTEEIKQELRSRCVPDVLDAEEENGSVQTDFTLAPESPPGQNNWRLKSGGVLDHSSSESDSLDISKLQAVLSSSDVRCLYLRRNQFKAFPEEALALIAHSLIDFDLSHNPLGRSGLITTPISMPLLQSLTLCGCRLSSLDPLFKHLSAPSLSFLDVSNNSLSGPLPHIRNIYPNLVTFLAAENQIDSVDFEAVQGLQVVDIGNNDIGFLPPRIGLLSPEEIGNRGSALRRFEVAGNSFRVPRWQTVAKGSEAVLEWLRNRVSDEELQIWQEEGA